MLTTFSYLVVASALFAASHAAGVTSGGHQGTSCKPTDTTCEFWLHIEHHLTMMNGRDALYPQGGQLYKYNDDTATTPVNVTNVISADGWEEPRLVVTINGSIPGPPIEVWEGQTLVVHVTNMMSSVSTTIHWHGLHQKGTPWMDGVAFVSQCPIEPLQTFTYRFKAYPSGTFWYHSHIGSQLSMGAVGALIIRRQQDIPNMEHIMMLQEWNHKFDADVIHAKMLFGNYESRKKMSASKSIEGTSFSMYPFHSGLINGRGRYYDNTGTHNGAPLTVFTVSENESYRFRMIGSGSLYPFRVSIDGHPLTVVASDGYEIEPITVDALIINPGERYDFFIHTNNTAGRYYVRAVTLEINVDNHVAEAILEYEGVGGSSVDGANSAARACTADNRCKVLNCPFLYYPESYFSDCIPVGSLKSGESHSVPGAQSGDDVTDIFLNFAFPGTTWTPGSVNGRAFRHPPVAAMTQPKGITMQCDPAECGEDKVCACTYSINLEHNKDYQMVMMNMGSGRGWAHPVHMHGHSFHVVKLGFPEYNNVTGQVGADSPDIDCGGQTDFCNEAKWADQSWGGNSVPGLELELPPRKDTIMVPSGGYVVVRIKADNPGVWFMHCHVELHNSDGMALVLNESFPHHPSPPSGFPTCGNFDYDSTRSAPQPMDNDDDDDDDIKEETFWIVVGCLAGVVVLQFLIIVVICLRSKPSGSSTISSRPPASFSNDGFVAK